MSDRISWYDVVIRNTTTSHAWYRVLILKATSSTNTPYGAKIDWSFYHWGKHNK